MPLRSPLTAPLAPAVVEPVSLPPVPLGVPVPGRLVQVASAVLGIDWPTVAEVTVAVTETVTLSPTGMSPTRTSTLLLATLELFVTPVTPADGVTVILLTVKVLGTLSVSTESKESLVPVLENVSV